LHDGIYIVIHILRFFCTEHISLLCAKLAACLAADETELVTIWLNLGVSVLPLHDTPAVFGHQDTPKIAATYLIIISMRQEAKPGQLLLK